MDSILTSIKKMLGIAEEYEQFDMDIIIHINSVLSILNDLGVGPESGYSIVSKETTWYDYVSNATTNNIETIKTYIYLKVKLIFDPPSNASAIASMEKLIQEFEWRIAQNAEKYQKEET